MVNVEKVNSHAADLGLKKLIEEFTVKRDSLHVYFMGIAEHVASRSTCIRRNVGAVLVKNKQIISTGYNGAPKGAKHADEVGCLRQQLNVPSGSKAEICRGVHAEQNAIIQAGINGCSTEGSTLYCTDSPCSICMKMLINAGVKEIYFKNMYADALALDLARECGVRFRKLK